MQFKLVVKSIAYSSETMKVIYSSLQLKTHRKTNLIQKTLHQLKKSLCNSNRGIINHTQYWLCELVIKNKISLKRKNMN